VVRTYYFQLYMKVTTNSTAGATRTATVFTRHGENCKDIERGPRSHECRCKKWLLTYDGTTQKQRRAALSTMMMMCGFPLGALPGLRACSRRGCAADLYMRLCMKEASV